MLEMRQLEALRAVAQTGSIARAAEYLDWSQPTVDHHLKKLDRVIGEPVLRRSAQGSSLTPVGAVVLERAHEILAMRDRTVLDARNAASLGHVRLRFGTFATAAVHLLPAIVARLGRMGMEIDATLEETTELTTHVNRRELDAALLYSVPEIRLPFRSDVVTTEVFRDPLLLAMPAHHSLASRKSIDADALASLAGERWHLGATREDPIDSVLLESLGRVAEDLEVAVRTDDCAVLLGMIAAGMVVGLVPQMAVGPVPEGVVVRPLDDPRFTRSVLLAYPQEAAVRSVASPTLELAKAVRAALDNLRIHNTGPAPASWADSRD